MNRVALSRRLLLGHRMKRASELGERWVIASVEEIETFQLRQLQDRWLEAVEHIPYYGKLVKSGFAPAEIESLAMFREEVPVLMRETLMENGELFRREVPPHHELMTAGSTGRPLRFGNWRDESVAHTAINQYVGRFQNGMDPDDKVFLLWGHSYLLGTGFQGALKHWKRKAQDWLVGYRRVDAYHVEPNRAREYLREMRRFRPQVVIGYAGALDLMARHSLQSGNTASDLGIKLCIACSEMFPRPDSREVLVKFFGCPVVMEYGGVDFGVCAYELLESGRYRVFWWSHLLEVEGDGTDGPLLVTNLTDRYLPLFRYRNGDVCEGVDMSPSGVLAGFDRIKGRVNDVLEMPDGGEIHSVGLFHCIHQEPVKSIQLVIGDDDMRLRLAAEEMTAGMESRIRNRLADLHPDLADCPIDVAPDLITNRAGKRRWIVDRRS